MRTFQAYMVVVQQVVYSCFDHNSWRVRQLNAVWSRALQVCINI